MMRFFHLSSHLTLFRVSCHLNGPVVEGVGGEEGEEGKGGDGWMHMDEVSSCMHILLMRA